MKFSDHKSNWKDCDLCPLCLTRKHVVLLRGRIPADVLFIGEAPGISEDIRGRPFDGPAGRLLDRMIEESFNSRVTEQNGELIKVTPTYAITNLIACIPVEDGVKAVEPPLLSVAACHDRLREAVWLVKPKLVVLVGKSPANAIKGEADFYKSTAWVYNEKLDRIRAVADKKEKDGLPWLGAKKHLMFTNITHPASILRQDRPVQGVVVQRMIATLTDAVDQLIESGLTGH